MSSPCTWHTRSTSTLGGHYALESTHACNTLPTTPNPDSFLPNDGGRRQQHPASTCRT
jgi:hypothetical protein